MASCADEPTAAEREAISDAKIAAVEAAQIVPAEELAPQPISYEMASREGFTGAGCSFTPAGSAEGPVLVTGPDLAYMRLNDQTVQFAADKGSAQLPLDSWSKYVGKARSLQLVFDNSAGIPGEIETVRFDGALLNVRDENDRTIYEANGTAECGS
ncbi:hypothetical protein G7A66_01780 [Altererythrobacter sp. SALINAS58]|uniref:hypothetical protein n=1 Tax=Alteripontixanthobacter muriae TaxID=2705546 RepID=UPI00157755F1|nr:hypothetical protein [Alteripontixanthobacter muriae]NTZ41838.1 hypothetical protein [Alteripontixanthobacter muriae]